MQFQFFVCLVASHTSCHLSMFVCDCTGNSFEVKIEADSSDVTDYVQDDKPRTNIGTKRSLKVHKSTNDGKKQYHCTVCEL